MGSRKRICQVPKCGNFKVFKEEPNRDDLFFFGIPKDKIIPWTNAIGRPDLAIVKKSNNYHVCSDHFREEDFLPNILNTVFNQNYKKRLKLDAVPSLLLPTAEDILKFNKERKQKQLIKTIKSSTDYLKLDDNKRGTVSQPNSPKNTCLLCSEETSCSSEITSTITPSNYQLSGSCQSTLLNEQLWSTFILRKIIQLPVWKFGELLKSAGLSVHPGKWFVLCDTCTQTVVNIMEIQDNIHKLELKVKELVNRMKIKFESSLEGKRGGDGDDDGEIGEMDVTREIRRFFKGSNAEPKVEVDMATPESDTQSNLDDDEEYKTESEQGEESEPSLQGGGDDYEIGEDEDWIPTRDLRQAEISDDDVKMDPLADNSEEDCNSKTSGTKDYRCKLCPRKYSIKHQLTSHMELHDKSKRLYNGRYDCSICGAPYEKSVSVQCHVKNVHRMTLHQLWDKSEESQKDFIYSSKTKKKVVARLKEKGYDISGVVGRPMGPRVLEAKYQCPICPKKLTKKGYLDKHMEYHELTKRKYNGIFDCARCGVPFVNHKNLRCHYSEQHKLLLDPRWKGEEEGVPQEDFLRELDAPRPKPKQKVPDSKIRNVDGIEDGLAKIKCPKCNLSCKSQVGLTNHLKKKHKMMEGPLVCELCGFVVDSKRKKPEMEAHMLTHKIFDNSVDPSISTTDFSCNLCHKLFSTRRDFRSHKLATHAEELGLQVYKCSYCSKVFPRNHNRMFHELRIHKKKGLFPCDQCDYEAVSRINLELHMVKHSKSKQVCEYCSATYRSISGFREHIRRFHPDKHVSVKKVRFAGVPVETLTSVEGDHPMLSLSVRRKQMQDKEVKCKYCDAVLPHQQALKMHWEEIHKDMYKYKCDLCEKVYMSLASLKLHKKINHKEKGNKVRCGWCFKLVAHRISLYDHRKWCQKRPKDTDGHVVPKIMPVDEENEEVVEQVEDAMNL